MGSSAVLINNYTANFSQYLTPKGRTIEYTKHAISGGEIILVILCFLFLAYWYIKVTNNKAYYESWKNTNGNTVNLYKKVRQLFWWYIGIVIILGIVEILIGL